MFLTEDSSTEILRNIITERKDYGFKIFDYPTESRFDYDKLVAFWKENGIHTMYISSEGKQIDQNNEREIYKLADLHKVRISLIPSIIKIIFFSMI
jgi:hypothetical protein